MNLTRRAMLQGTGLGAAAMRLAPGRALPASHAAGAVTISYHVNLPSWDPTVGLSAVNPTIQTFYQTV